MSWLTDIFSKKNAEPEIRYVERKPNGRLRVIKTSKPKEKPGHVKGWDAAKGGDLNADWFAPAITITQMQESQLEIVRARCREALRNDEYAQKFRANLVSNVVGPKGIRLQSMPLNPDGSRDELAGDAIELAWNEWGKYGKNVDVSGKENFKGFLELLWKTYCSDGEMFVRFITGSRDGGDWGFRLQAIDPYQCDSQLTVDLKNGNKVIMGVEFDKWRKPTAYYFLTDDREGLDFQQGRGVKHVRIPAEEILHVFISDYPNQVRGIPPLAASLTGLRHLRAYEEAAVINARAGASKMGFYTRDGDDIDPATEIDDDGELIEEIEPGVISLLPKGYEFQMYESKYPDGEIADFKKSILRRIASGIGVDYPTLGNDLEGVNLSSARVGINETHELWKSVQQFCIDSLVTPIFEAWLEQALIRGKIEVANRPLSVTRIDKFKQAQWLPRRWQFADPAKDSKNAIDMINNRVKSVSTVAAEIGIDWDAEAQRIAKDEETLRQLGLQRIGAQGQETDQPEESADSSELNDEDSNEQGQEDSE